jgi:sugar fermentation stimulation protein A
MKFDTPLIPATLIRRYKRFLADVTLADGREVTAHVANPGSMLGMRDAGLQVWLETNDNPKRKLKYSWKLAELGDGTLIGVDTSLPNKIVDEALRGGAIPELNYANIQPEVKYGESSRVDFLLTHEGRRDCYLEIKSVTLSRTKGRAEFPDSVTKRGARHMEELANMAQIGHRAVLLFLVQRNDVKSFDIAGDIDPEYLRAFTKAIHAGVEVFCYGARISNDGIWLDEKINNLALVRAVD